MNHEAPGRPVSRRCRDTSVLARTLRRGASVGLAAALVSGLGVAATAAPSGASSGKAKFHSLLPASIQKSGTITDASAFDYPPYAYTASTGKYTGAEITMLDDLAPLLGVKFQFKHYTEFSSLVPAVGDGRVEMASESVGITPPRLKIVSYVEYGLTGEGLLVQKGNPSGITDSAICGHSVAVEAGAVEVTFYKTISAKCTAAGKPAVTVPVYATEPAQVLAVEDGHADAVGVGSVTVRTIADKSNGSLVALHGTVPGGTLPLGLVFNPKETKLMKAVYQGVKYLEKKGVLAKINKKYDFVNSFKVRIVPSTGS